MSETVHYKGKLKLVEKLKNETLEQQCERILKEYNYLELREYCDSWEEMFNDEFYEEYCIVDDNIFKVIEKQKMFGENVFVVKHNSDGAYDFEVMYYNGGCSFDEAINEAFQNMNNGE